MRGHGDFSIGSKVWPGVSKLLEEMGELGQVLGKLLGTAGESEHWDGTNLRVRLVEEMADVTAALRFVREYNLSAEERRLMHERARVKLARFEAWHAGDPSPAGQGQQRKRLCICDSRFPHTPEPGCPGYIE